METKNGRLTWISVLVTILALAAIIARIMVPTMIFDNITLWLIVIAIVPWLVPRLPPLIKSIDFGGLRIEFQRAPVSVLVTILALMAIIARIMVPTMLFDSITLWLFVIALVPWLVPLLAPLIKNIDLGWLKVEFQKLGERMDDMTQKVNDMMRDTASVSKPQSIDATSPFTPAFVHVASNDNTKLNYTIIDNPLANNNRNAIVIVTQNWSPPTGEGRVYNPQSIGVWYTNDDNTPEGNGKGRWSIFNEDTHVEMPIGTAFNVLVLSQR